MSEERKKVERKVITKIEPKKRPEPEPEIEQPRVKASNDKYVRLVSDGKAEDYRAMSDRARSGDVKWSHFAIDGNQSYNYYIVLR